MTRSVLAIIIAVSISLLLVASPVAAEQSDDAEIVAHNAIVIDAQTGNVLFERAADQPVPPASLTKIFTAVAAAEITAADRPMTVTTDDLVGEASMGLSAGETDTFDTLLHGMLLSSGNDAAMTIARNLSATNGNLVDATTAPFVAYANARVADLGATGTHLVNPHGLDAPGHVSTARDLATITRYGLTSLPAFREALGAASYAGDGHTLFSTNQLTASYPGLIGGKTGITDNAGYCLIEVAERDGRTIIAVLLGSTVDAWYSDASTLLDRGFATPITAPASAVQSQPTSADVTALTVTGSGEEHVVSSATVAGRKTHAPGIWAAMAIVAVPGFTIVGLLLARLFSTQPRPTRRRVTTPVRRPAPARPVVPTGATAPFLTVTAAPRHSIPAHRPPRRAPATSAASAPSFGD